MADINKDQTPASIWLVSIGILLAGIGWMVAAGSDRAGANSGGLGNGIIVVGGLLFALGLLIEFFSIGASLRRLAATIPGGRAPGHEGINNDVPPAA